ncbi:acylphosphatase [Sporolactobacillus laevolacticus]|jgi:acylphosphatase|uniref:acylphosphatase n=1 Tax=Sporolactobacillus laevolacticus TaxID=33018 RepID=UPI0025B4F84B|nr:acylphosphatase [Sporolactobacillus laevolacticus]MDF2909412.1 acylphosphatase [Sporolactobacillus laevolacticus]MDN3955454.1 acylphosphatase [Sporolactobacillus laevolacticus]
MNESDKRKGLNLMGEPERIISLHLVVEGRVQAVGFRYFTWQTANVYRISGWVRNREDGSVEIAAEGEETDIKQFVKTIKKGSPFSRIKHVDIYEYSEPKNYKLFEIKNSI